VSTYESWTLALQASVAVAGFATLAFLYKQARAMIDQIVATHESTRAQSALALANFLQSEEVRQARHCVRSVLSQKDHTLWSIDEKACASLVCSNYDVAACLLRSKLAPVDLFVVNWGPSILHCHEVLTPYILEFRSKPGGHRNYWTNFDWLCDQVASLK
jgi:hypothetical protein